MYIYKVTIEQGGLSQGEVSPSPWGACIGVHLVTLQKEVILMRCRYCGGKCRNDGTQEVPSKIRNLVGGAKRLRYWTCLRCGCTHTSREY